MSSGAITFAGLSILVWVLVGGYFLLLGRFLSSTAAGMWMQLGITWAAVLLTSLVLPLGSLGGVSAVLVLASAPAILVGLRRSRLPRQRDHFPWKSRRALSGLVLLLVIAIGLSLQTPGPVTGFDSGLYHLAVISQSLDFGALPGVGNLYAPYAYHNGLFPFTGFLSAVTASDQAFRLINGLLFLMALLDLYVRWVTRVTKPGTYVVAVGLFVVALLTLPLGDFWFFSPTPDTAVFILYIVFTAYLVDALAAVDALDVDRSLGYALVVGAIAGSIRPLYLLPVAIAILVVVLRQRRAPSELVRSRIFVGSLAIAGSVVVFGLARDVLLSGWLWYPLGLVSLPVEWMAPDPAPVRDVALAFNRAGYTGSEYMWSATGWDWVSLWISDYLPMNRGTLALLAGLSIIAIVSMAVHRSRQAPQRFWFAMSLAVVPSLLTVVVWFVATPPAFRFVWGPLFMIPIIVIAWNASSIGNLSRFTSRDGVVAFSVVAVASVAVGSALLAVDRFDTGDVGPARVLGVTASAQRLPSVDYVAVQLDSGVDILAPTGPMFLCWNEPVCSREPADGLDGRTSAVRDGFVHSLE